MTFKVWAIDFRTTRILASLELRRDSWCLLSRRRRARVFLGRRSTGLYFWVWLMTFKVWAIDFRTTRILASLEAAPEPETLATRRELSSCLASLSLAVSSALGFPRRSEALTLVILSVQSVRQSKSDSK